MASKVYFVDSAVSQKKSVLARLSVLFKRAGLDACVSEGDLVAVKVHFGELGNTAYLSPIYARTVIADIRELGGKPFLTDSNTLYKGHRQNGVDHLETALANGFGYATVNAPLVIADGIWGRDYRTVTVDGAVHCPEVKIGAAAVDADSMIVLTHFKGHMAMGFGGTFKNVGMGLGARAAKQVMHSDLRPDVDAPTCTRCGDCVKFCPASAIVLGAESAVIDMDACIGCGECTATCRYGAIAVKWETEAADLQRRVAEHFAGAVKGKEGKVGYVSFIISVTPDCDCWQFTDPPFVGDIGILASTDPVALDQAAFDLVTAALPLAGSRIADLAPGEDKFLALHGVDGTAVLEHAETLGLGSRDYELVRL
jgi:uncharacterized Fe-S center protein